MTSLAAVAIGATGYLIVSNGPKIWSMDTSGALVEIGEGFTAGTYWSIIQAEKGTAETAGPVYLSNGVDAPQYWAGTEAKTKVKEWKSKTAESEERKFVATPKAKYLTYAGNRVWAAGMSSEPSAVRFTETVAVSTTGAKPDPTEWPELNVILFDPEDGRPITGLGRVGPYVLVFKSHKTWVITGLDEGQNRKLSASIGCVANRSIVESEGGTYFLTADQGVYLTNGSSVREVSYNVRPTLLEMNPAKREQAAGAYQNNHYYLSFAAGTSATANRTLDYDVTLKSWWLHDISANQWVDWDTTAGGEPSLFFCKPELGVGVAKAFVPSVYTDLGKKYTGNGILGCWWISAWEPFAYYIFRHRIKAPFLKKRVRQLFVNGSGEIIPIVYKDFTAGGTQLPGTVGNSNQAVPTFPVNFSQNSTIFGNENETQLFAGELYEGVEMIFGGRVETGAARMYSLGTAFVWGFGWGNNTAEPFEVDSYAMMLSFRKS